MRETRLMSFDTSTTCSGWALFKDGVLSGHGVIDLDPRRGKAYRDSEARIGLMMASLLRELDMITPDIVVIERPPLARDAQTLINLSEIVGAVRGWAAVNEADYVEYFPGTWRRFVADPGEAVPRKRAEAKPWDVEKARAIFGFDPLDDNEADAALIGQARINECRLAGG